jgi:two-component system, chemotaxis family, sensor kinase CheA
MSAELDMTQYLDLFLQEADEQLEILEQETLKLEREPTQERLSIIFRAAHTLKGSSRAMGYINFANLTHEMENVLDQLRHGTIQVTTEIANALLGCLDSLSEIKGNIAEGKGEDVDCSALIVILQRFANESADTTPAAAPAVATDAPAELSVSPEIAEALSIASTQKPVYQAHFKLRPDCVMKFVRVFMAISIVQDGGELLASVPNTEMLEEEQFELDFALYFHHADAASMLKTKLSGVGEIEHFDVKAWEPTSVPSANDQVAAAAAPIVAAAPKPPTVAAEAAGVPKQADTGQTVRVDVARLDELMNLVGELVIDRTRVAQIGGMLAAKYEYDENVEALGETVGHITRITANLQDQIMKARMLPIETVFNRFPRMVRDLAQKIGKEITLELVGGDTELDRSVIEVIGDPLLHILRNSIDHGIETPDEREAAGKERSGHVTVSARHQENHIVIEIQDDGKGIDYVRIRNKAVQSGLITKEAGDRLSEKECLQFIFTSGLSTAEQVSEVSGRGVGMDIVRSNIQKLGGIIDLDTTVGEGTKFSLRLPLTLAIIRGLLVKVSGVVYVIPLGSVIETLNVTKKQLQTVHKQEVIVIRGMTTPLVRLRTVFTTKNAPPLEKTDSHYVVIVGLADHRIGLVVDSLIGEQEVVIKSLSRFCGEVPGVTGATILGNGNVALIVDVNGIFNSERK